MRMKLAGFLIAALLTSAAFGQQTVTRMYSFTHVKTVQEFQEIATTMRTISGVKDASTDNAQFTATVTGTPEQIGITDWLFKELDQPPQGQAPVTYNVSVDDVVELIYLPPAQSTQEFFELINGIRTVLEIRYAFGINAQHTFAFRAPAAQVVLAAKLVDDLSQPTPSASMRVYPSATADDVTQVYFLTHPSSVQDFQEIANGVRTIAQIRRVIALNAPRALLIRATATELAMATWLLHDLDQAQTAPASHSFQGSGDAVRVFYLLPTGTVQDFQATANKVRTTAQIRMAVALNTPRAIVVRGTMAQVSQADQIVQDLTAPAR
jgi:hypothetical protein